MEGIGKLLFKVPRLLSFICPQFASKHWRILDCTEQVCRDAPWTILEAGPGCLTLIIWLWSCSSSPYTRYLDSHAAFLLGNPSDDWIKNDVGEKSKLGTEEEIDVSLVEGCLQVLLILCIQCRLCHWYHKQKWTYSWETALMDGEFWHLAGCNGFEFGVEKKMEGSSEQLNALRRKMLLVRSW